MCTSPLRAYRVSGRNNGLPPPFGQVCADLQRMGRDGLASARTRLTFPVAPVFSPALRRPPLPRLGSPESQDVISMHPYRSHTCGALRAADAGQTARLSGWVHAKRDHGSLLFIDLRDHYGITQCVFAKGAPVFGQAEGLRPESVITVTGTVLAREADTSNSKLPTGEIELRVTSLVVQSAAEVLPMQVAGEEKFPEDIRLRYRFIDLRRDKLHRNMVLRSNVITSIRRRMIEAGVMEYQSPILTASSPEGARHFLVPAPLHPRQVYA